VNLDSYFSRISYNGPKVPTLDVLRQIIHAHSCSIPFENVDVLHGRGVSLVDAHVEHKLVQERCGGYCFEQNSLLLRVLTALGFSATPLSARVRLKAPRDVIPQRTHLFLRVSADGGPWLVDVGVGSLSPTGPVQLDLMDQEQTTPHEPRRIVREEGEPMPHYFHQAKIGDTWADVYEFTLEEMPPIDREVGNWWTSTSPASRFRHNLTVSIAGPDGTRLSILNREFTRRRRAERLERFEFSDTRHLLRVLEERFGIRLPSDTTFAIP
jgi:N-hydroxyarylamine O-acetyltransferase